MRAVVASKLIFSFPPGARETRSTRDRVCAFCPLLNAQRRPFPRLRLARITQATMYYSPPFSSTCDPSQSYQSLSMACPMLLQPGPM